MTAEPQQAITEPEPTSPGWRKWVTVILIVVTSVAGVGALVGIWVDRTLLNTNRFMSVVEPSLERFSEAVGPWAGNQVLEVLMLEDRIEVALAGVDELIVTVIVEAFDPSDRLLALLERLPRPSLAALAPGIAAPIEERIYETVVEVVSFDAVADTLPSLVERAHRSLVALAKDDLEEVPNVYVADGEVWLNMLGVIAQVLAPVQEEIREVLPDVTLPALVSDRVDDALDAFRQSLGEAVPDDFGQVRLMSEDDLGSLQTFTRILQRTVLIWLVVTIVLVAVTLYTATNWKRTAMHLLFGFAIALGVAALILGYLEGAVLSAVTSGDDALLVSSFLIEVFARLRLIIAIFLVAAGVVAIAGLVSQRETPADIA